MKVEDSRNKSVDDLLNIECQSKLLTELDNLVENGKAEIELVYYSVRPGANNNGGTCGFSGTLSGSAAANLGGPNGSTASSNAQGGSATTSASANGNVCQRPKLKRGKAYRYVATNEVFCFVSGDNVAFKPGDSVYIDSQRLDQPYFIAGIQSFKITKRDQLNAQLKWYYRPCEIPESVYRSLVQDRHIDNNSTGVGCSSICLKDPVVQSRELFASDAIDTYPVSALRGKCVVYHLKDIGTTANDKKKLTRDDSFFYVLGYNPENNRLASILGEIRVGPSHQAKLPELKQRIFDPSLQEAKLLAGDEKERETLIWTPNCLPDGDILMYIRAARSMAVFAGMCDGGTTEDGCLVVARDQTTVNAYDLLHEANYETGPALQKLVKNPAPLSAEKKWNDDETKKFVRGLKLYGKNFFKIRHELLQQKTTSQLIEFYYLWKKTPTASSQRPRPRQRRPQNNILRRVKPGPANGKPPRPSSNEFLDLSSASEHECDSDSSDTKDLSGYACHHCYTTTSKNWHHAGKNKTLLCVDCRLYFKKYGELRPVDRSRTPPPFLFTPVKETLECSESMPALTSANGGVKTRRAGGKSVPVTANGRRKPLTPTADMEKFRATIATPKSLTASSPTSGKKSPKSKAQKRKHNETQLPQPQKGENDSADDSSLMATPSKLVIAELDLSPENAVDSFASAATPPALTPAVENATKVKSPAKSKDSAPKARNSAAAKRNRTKASATRSPVASPSMVASTTRASTSSGDDASSSGGNEGDTEMRDDDASGSSPDAGSSPDDMAARIGSGKAIGINKETNSSRSSPSKSSSYESSKMERFEAICSSVAAKVISGAMALETYPATTASPLPIPSTSSSVPNSQPVKKWTTSELLSPPVLAAANSPIRSPFEKVATQLSGTSGEGSFRVQDPSGFESSRSAAPSVIKSMSNFIVKDEPPDLIPYMEPVQMHSMQPSASTSSTLPVSCSAPVLHCPTAMWENRSTVDEEEMESSINSRLMVPGAKEPEPKIDDAEFYRSKNAIFRRHWYRGEMNSCSRTDLVYMPLPDSAFARRRQETSGALQQHNGSTKQQKAGTNVIQIKQEKKDPVEQQSSSQHHQQQQQRRSVLPSPHPPPPGGPPDHHHHAATPQHAQSYLHNLHHRVPPVGSSGRSVVTPAMPYLQRLQEYAAAAVSSSSHSQNRRQPSPAGPTAMSDKDRQDQQRHNTLRHDFDLATGINKPTSSASSFPPVLAPIATASVMPNVPATPSTSGAAASSQPPPLQPSVVNNNSNAFNAAFGLGGASPFHPLQQAALLSPPVGWLGGATSAVPNDPVNLDRYVASLSNLQLQLERQFALAPTHELRRELDHVGAQLTALAAGTQHHTHSHTHSHTHLHIHPPTSTTATTNATSTASTSQSRPSIETPAPPTPNFLAPNFMAPGFLAPSPQNNWSPSEAALATQYAALMRHAFQQQQHQAAATAAALGFAGVPHHLLPPQHQQGLDPLAAERLQQLQHQEFQRRLLMDRDLAFSQQQSLLQQNEMMRRLQQEGNMAAFQSFLSSPLSSLALNAHHQSLVRPAPSPFENKRM